MASCLTHRDRQGTESRSRRREGLRRGRDRAVVVVVVVVVVVREEV
jgi:hypothetical protein